MENTNPVFILMLKLKKLDSIKQSKNQLSQIIMLSDDKLTLANLSSKTIFSIIQTIDVDKLKFSGYLQIKLNDENQPKSVKTWNLFFSRGKIVFSGIEIISFQNILSVLNNYLPALRNNKLIASETIEGISDKSQTQKDVLIVGLLGELALSNKNFNYQQFSEIIQSHIIADAEKYLFLNAIEAKLISNKKIDYLRPIIGLKVERLCSLIELRKAKWSKVKNIIPSLDYQVKCNVESSQWKQLSVAKKIKIRKLVNYGDTLEEIRYALGEENLKIAQIFSKLVTKELVIVGRNINSSEVNKSATFEEKSSKTLPPQLVIIDDSLVLLKQFSSVVKALGYRIECCDDALKAVELLLKDEPKVIFIDVNMPELSGFQLIKQIRSNPKLAQIQLVILTAEKNMMNKQRAKWSKSIFLSKPLNSEDRERFVAELKNLLQDLAPITS